MRVQKTHVQLQWWNPTTVRKVHSDSHNSLGIALQKKNNSALRCNANASPDRGTTQRPSFKNFCIIYLASASARYKATLFCQAKSLGYWLALTPSVTFGNLSVWRKKQKKGHGALHQLVRPNSALTLNCGTQQELHRTAHNFVCAAHLSGDMFHQLPQNSNCRHGGVAMPLNFCHW